MTRRSNNATAEAEQPKNDVDEWKTKAHGDGDLRLPKTLRTKLGIKGHGVYCIKIVEQAEGKFTLSFQLSE